MSFSGFDQKVYPGDSVMEAGKASLPYSFCGYYLASPCHPNASWMGTHDTLVSQQWNMLIIYVGQQVAGGPCPQNNVNAAQGLADAIDAAAKASSEGFPSGSSVYLDVEPIDPGSPDLDSMKDYVEAWVQQMLTSTYKPAIYCHKKNADAMQAVVAAAGGDASTRFWVTGSGTIDFSIADDPTDSGVAFATVWQNPVSTTQAFGNVNVDIDENVSSMADPSAPSA
jgi:hypothetical protein